DPREPRALWGARDGLCPCRLYGRVAAGRGFRAARSRRLQQRPGRHHTTDARHPCLDPSLIKTIDVREGERVKAGEVLATLDPTFASADVSALKSQIASLDAQIVRCEAELAKGPYLPPPTTDPAATQYGQLQKSYYTQRRAQFDG